MDESVLVTVLLALVATLFGFLIAILSWMGNKVYNKLSEMAATMVNIDSDLRGELSHLDRRVAVVETKVQTFAQGAISGSN